MSRFTLDSASEFLFGHRMHALSGHLPFPCNAHFSSPYSSTSRGLGAAPGSLEFAQAFLEAQEVISNRERYGWTWPLSEMWGDKSKQPMKVVNAHLAPIIRDAVQKKEAREKEKGKVKEQGVGDEETLIDHLVELTSGKCDLCVYTIGGWSLTYYLSCLCRSSGIER
jgi:hypothetical protein